MQQDEHQPTGMAEGGEAETSAQMEALKAQVAVAEDKARSYLANWQRTQADLENYRKRVQQDRREALELAHSSLVSKLLAAIDDLDRAFARPHEERGTSDWIEGVRLSVNKLMTALESEGLTVIDAVGQPFDPRMHDAVMQQPGANGVVLAVLQKGYTLNGRVLRPAAVVVGVSEKSEPVEKE